MPLTVNQTAELLNMHPKAVYRSIHKGLLKATPFGRLVLMIQPSDLREYVINHPRPSRVAHVNVHALV
jgi:excisionase family DNA binding protein